MKIASIISRYLLGLMFTVMGFDGLIHFIHRPAPSNPLELQFLSSVTASHFGLFLFGVQAIGGLLLLSGYFVPLALTLLAAEIYCIIGFHIAFDAASIGPALFCAVAWVLVFLSYRQSFKSLLAAKPAILD